MTRQNYSLAGVDHGDAPIPMAARIGRAFRTSAVPGKDPETGTVPDDGARQVDLVFANVRRLLEIAGLEDDDVLFVEVLLEDERLRSRINERWCDWFTDGASRPARHITVRPLPANLLVQLRVEAEAGDGVQK